MKSERKNKPLKPERKCGYCEEIFNPIRTTKIYCSDRCRYFAFLDRQENVTNDNSNDNKNGIQTVNGKELFAIENYRTASMECKNVYDNDKKSDKENGNNNDKNTLEANAKKEIAMGNNAQLPQASEPFHQPENGKTLNYNMEEDYNWINSGFVEKIEKRIDTKNNILKFRYPQDHWSHENLQIIEWVTIRFRCLLENTLKLCYHSQINHATMETLTQGFEEVLQSIHFKCLSPSYPYTGKIKELAKKLRIISDTNANVKNIRFLLTEKKKIEIIFIIYETRDFVPLLKFNDLFKIN